MVSIRAMYATGSVLTVHFSHAGRNYHEHVGRCECVNEENLAIQEYRSEQRVESLLDETEGCTDEELARFRTHHHGEEKPYCSACHCSADWYSPTL